MTIGQPFNPYKVFQGVFAPYWVLEHKGIAMGAKVCYIRMLGYAGQDARCYPGLGTLGTAIGVSERQARDYVKDLEKAGLIKIEQRGLRKTNMYLFLWTAELDRLMNHVPERSEDPDDPTGEVPPEPERNNPAGQDRNPNPDRNRSTAERNNPAAPKRNNPAGPIGNTPVGITSGESSSSGQRSTQPDARKKKTEAPAPEHTGNAPGEDQTPNAVASSPAPPRPPDSTEETQTEPTVQAITQTIQQWATARDVARVRADRTIGLPDAPAMAGWAAICAARGIVEPEGVYAVMDWARAGADTASRRQRQPWNSWSFLTLQVRIAAESVPPSPARQAAPLLPPPLPPEDATTEWARAKASIRTKISEIAAENWLRDTRQVARRGDRLTVDVPDPETQAWLTTEYGALIQAALADVHIAGIEYTVGRSHHEQAAAPRTD
jgi:hypothetical protein